MNEGISGLPQDFIRKALGEVDKDFLSAYPDYSRIYGKIAGHNNIKPENIHISNGSCAAIKHVYETIISCNDKVLLTDLTFAMYPVYCTIFRANPVIVDYKDDLSFPYDEFTEKLSRNIKMAVIVNPNNPAGTDIEPDKLLFLIKRAEKMSVFFLVDEAYFYYLPETVIEKVSQYRNLIVLRTFSKLCSMASLRFGYAAGHEDFIKVINKVKSSYEVNGVAVLFAERLLDEPDILNNIVNQIDESKNYLYNELDKYDIEYKKSSANFILIKCNDRVDDIISMLADNNILVSGRFTHEILKDYIRVTIGEKSIMESFFDKFITIWKKQL